ncbi:LamG-like jellyroll fold domain-containing protein [Gilvibacter sediminis]|uniref:LamG-like jellyroll fold domain-containing protein n=1 Tax=Gilvibacter sediminis TaxID=379071 RepID=UPI002350F2F7|nr:LamG-like jellyroll fold domain-containing protein [Gilvibacter sediminis]MDC7998172.1 T9SS type A sorting domain-containing protein [Gilvibacter sediminis]
MKTITSKRILGFLFVGTMFLFQSQIQAQTVLHQTGFESGTDGWTITGGSRAASTSYAYAGSWSIQLFGNTTNMVSPGLALASYDKVDIRFHFVNRGIDTGETLILEYRPDAVSSWQVLNSYRSGNVSSKDSDFQYNAPSSVDYTKIFSIFATDYTFPILATGQFRLRPNADATTDYIHIDEITITGTTYNVISTGPGGVTSGLELWLQADKVDGSGVATNNTDLNSWQDTGKGNDANTMVSTQAPVYKNNATDNINFNPVIEFSNSSATSSSDMGYLTARDELTGTGGFYSHDIFMVVTPDEPITNTMIPLDTFTGKDPTGTTAQEDVTGFGYGAYTNRFTNEYFAYCIGTTSGPGNGYGRGDLTFNVDLNNVGIINARHNAVSGATGQMVYFNNIDIGDSESDSADFAEISNQKYYIGRSQYWNGSFGGRIAEIITYSSTNADGSASDARNRIQSYLAIKYGITLGVNGVSQDYVDSSGNLIWDQSEASAAFNYDIAGIGRSDAAGWQQKQSKSINDNTMITMGITDIATTNSSNTNSIPVDESYLVWGNNSGSLTAAPAVNVDLSASIPGLSTPVEFTSISRTWKVVESGGDVPEVTVSVPEISLSATLTPPGSYLMFISNTPSFSPTSEYRIMTLNGSDLETSYDFNGTKYITFGYAPQYIYERSVDFDGTADYLDADDVADINSAFSMSAWIKTSASNTDADIISKRDAAPFTQGYALRIDGSGQLQATWTNNLGLVQSVSSNTVLTDHPDEWHHVAVIFDGSTASLYIDGVFDSASLTPFGAPVGNSQHLMVGAADYLSPQNFFDGTIDEVRIWRQALTVQQLRYIMNQELYEHTDNSVDGTIIPQSITLNEVESIDWPNLIVYYPMNVYTFTNINDSSGNNNVAAIKNLDTVDFQTAPLPYETASDGDWTDPSTWTNNSVQYLPQSASIVDGTIIGWNVVDINHEVTSSSNTTVLAAMVDSSASLIMDNENKLEVSHYFELDGFLDLQGDSQLVQTAGSDLEVTSSGYMERGQGGTADLYTYNYWSSPVGRNNAFTLNWDYKVNNRLRDGSSNINWVWGYDGAAGSPVSLSARWIFRFEDGPVGDYDSWEFVGPYQYFSVGQGFTMKGPGTGGVTDVQNYTFTGKPNNDQTSHEIQLSISANNNYLVGNPFPSALDANDFIADNPHLDGTLYFWEHFGGGSHFLAEYQGGYGMYNLSGSVAATSHPMVSDAGASTKSPGRYVPVAQGFFVAADSDGTINFNNSQRNFVKLGGSSVFMFTDDTYTGGTPTTGDDPTTTGEPDDTQFDAPDTRTKLRIGFDSPIGMHRQLLVTFDNNTTLGFDRGYDGKVFDEQAEDMNWLIDDTRYAIQGIPVVEGKGSVRLPLYVKIEEFGEITIGLDGAEFLGEKLIPYLHDKETDTFVDLRSDYFTTLMEPGIYENRFQMVFRKTERQVDQVASKQVNTVAAMHAKSTQQVTVFAKEQELTIKQVTVYSILGQQIGTYQFAGNASQVSFPSTLMSTGTYILQITTDKDVQTTKILIDKQ